jgi:hypothetical protein
MSKTPWFKPTGVLDPDKHEKLIANRHGYAQDAGIPQELLWRPLPALAPGVKDWIARFRQHRSEGCCGLLLTGTHPTERDMYKRVAENATLIKKRICDLAPTICSWQFARPKKEAMSKEPKKTA